MGIFTTIRVLGGVPWFFADHVARLREGARALGLPAPEPAWLEQEVRALTRGRDDARVRITLAGGPPLVEARPFTRPVAPWRLRPVHVSIPGDGPLRKTTDRRRYDEARAQAPGYDDALLEGPDGVFLECTVANVFVLGRDGVLVTPPADSPLLPGIGRARVLQAARALGIEVREEPLDAARAAGGRACFVTNALLIAHPVASIEGVATYPPSPLARHLREAIPRTGP